MKLRTLSVFLLLAILAAFVFVNWSAFTAPTSLSVVFTTIEAPLGLLLLGFTALITAVFLFLLLVQQAGVIVEARRTAKELSAQRALADQAEASRFTALREHLDQALQRLETQSVAHKDGLTQRLDRLEETLRAHVDQTASTLAAYIGEVDNRVEHLAAAGQPTPPAAKPPA
jgi:uncharacterized integral membrane protein